MIISIVHMLELKLRGDKCFVKGNIAKDKHGSSMSSYWHSCGDIVGDIIETVLKLGFSRRGLASKSSYQAWDIEYKEKHLFSKEWRVKKYPEEESYFQKNETDIFSTILSNK